MNPEQNHNGNPIYNVYESKILLSYSNLYNDKLYAVFIPLW